MHERQHRGDLERVANPHKAQQSAVRMCGSEGCRKGSRCRTRSGESLHGRADASDGVQQGQRSHRGVSGGATSDVTAEQYH